MDDFDLDFNGNIGTPVSKIKENEKMNLDFNLDNNYKEDKLYKKDLNMNQLVRNLELKLDTKKPEIIEIEHTPDTFYSRLQNFKHSDLLLYVFIFILLNTGYVIVFINNFLIKFQKNNISTGNIVVRTILFSIMIYLIKKYN
jgi:hypothetical protein